jgi:hypothetical protein
VSGAAAAAFLWSLPRLQFEKAADDLRSTHGLRHCGYCDLAKQSKGQRGPLTLYCARASILPLLAEIYNFGYG